MRIANYLANELIVKGLANNKSFQQFALRTARNMEKLQGQGIDHSDHVVHHMKKQANYFTRFFAALRVEVQKDIDYFSKRG